MFLTQVRVHPKQ